MALITKEALIIIHCPNDVESAVSRVLNNLREILDSELDITLNSEGPSVKIEVAVYWRVGIEEERR